MLSLFRAIGNQPLTRMSSFAALGVHPQLVSRLQSLGMTEPTPIQEKAIPIQLRNEYPVVVSSETGSGKTLAYLLPYLQDHEQNPNTRMMVVVPRKELAYQVDSVLHQLAPSVSSAVLVGKGEPIERGVFPNVIVGTSEPLHRFVKKAIRKCNVESLAMYQRTISKLVLDEADILLNDPFKNNVLESFHILRKTEKTLKVVAVGATLPRNGRCTAGGVLESELKGLHWIEGVHQNCVPDSVSVEFIESANEEEKTRRLMEYAPKLMNIASLLFVQNARRGVEVASLLRSQGIRVQTLSKDESAVNREMAMKRLLNGSPICTICTDVLSRGVDTTKVRRVIQFDFARDVSSFLHRCGRTGRHGSFGEVVCFVMPQNELLYRGIQKCGVHGDLSSLYSRKRLLRKKEKKVSLEWLV